MGVEWMPWSGWRRAEENWRWIGNWYFGKRRNEHRRGQIHAEINLRNWGIILELDLTGGMWDYSFSVMLGPVYVDVSWDHHD